MPTQKIQHHQNENHAKHATHTLVLVGIDEAAPSGQSCDVPHQVLGAPAHLGQHLCFSMPMTRDITPEKTDWRSPITGARTRDPLEEYMQHFAGPLADLDDAHEPTLS